MTGIAPPHPSIQELSGLSAAALAFLLPETRKGLPQRTVLLTADESSAERLYRDLQFQSSFRSTQWEGVELLYLPGWEQSPYRNLQPSLADRLDRIRVSRRVMSSEHEAAWVLVASQASFLQRSASPAFLAESFRLGAGSSIAPDALCAKLVRFGFSASETVEDPGTFSLRGGIVDIFPPSIDQPVRFEFFDEEIESARIFNPETQRSIRLLGTGDSVEIVPAREFACDAESLSRGRERMKDWCDRHDLPRTARERLSSLLSQGIVTPEMDYMLPFFQDEPAWIPDLIPKGAGLVTLEPESMREARERWLERQQEMFEGSLSRQHPIPNPEDLHLALEQALGHSCWASKAVVRELSLGAEAPRFERIRLGAGGKSADVEKLLHKLAGLREIGSLAVLVANSQSQLDRLLFLLSQHKVRAVAIRNESDLPKDPSIVALFLGTVSESFHLPEKRVAFLSEDEIFGEKQHISKPRKKTASPPVAMEDLATGDLVVHSEHGIGRYLGLSTVKALQSEGDFALIEYADGDKLYVPVYRLEALSRYIGAAGASASLDKLGSGSFAKAKEKVKAAVKDIAGDLLRVQAERASREGFSFSPPDEEFRRFEAEFPYDETPDQEKAINDAVNDMHSPQPMDRLVCGDVGFGKTEVAIRAAFKAAQDGKQVAVLVPTTILAEQHYLTFSQRMSGYPVRVASLSRFKSRKEQAAVVRELREGKLDIVIGTHRLLSKDISFKDLGLLVIDEEQRFGVEHKEKLKQMRAITDVLTLTATPIPRTLQMSLMGLKDVSIIRTPPGDRLSIKTHLATFDTDLIASAIRNEISRGGQVFFIHNRVQTIGKMEETVRAAVPEAKTVVAHGQMPETQLERAMIGFYKKQFDVLIATAIIENGLDVPNANTLIVNRADTFGLSQLYQIRGRVGRSQTRAYAYFLIPETAAITQDARDRLAVLQRFVELGSGYSIATHDLEIRGGGDVLGQAQSGHIASVGYEMYLDLLQGEIQQLKGQKRDVPKEEVEINVPFAAVLPHDYVPDMKARLTLYRRLSAVGTEEETESARQELEDRYGPLPKEAGELLWVLRLKVLMRRMGLKTLSLGPKGISLAAGADPVLSPQVILALVQNRPHEFSILPEGKFVIRGQFQSGSQVFDKLRHLLEISTQ
jgi:transcription-repair coupling factor (superfamily II helicase)